MDLKLKGRRMRGKMKTRGDGKEADAEKIKCEERSIGLTRWKGRTNHQLGEPVAGGKIGSDA